MRRSPGELRCLFGTPAHLGVTQRRSEVAGMLLVAAAVIERHGCRARCLDDGRGVTSCWAVALWAGVDGPGRWLVAPLRSHSGAQVPPFAGPFELAKRGGRHQGRRVARCPELVRAWAGARVSRALRCGRLIKIAGASGMRALLWGVPESEGGPCAASEPASGGLNQVMSR